MPARQSGVVQSFTPGGWGFINSAGGEVFVHQRETNGQVLEPGDWVMFELWPDRFGRGPRARKVEVVNGA
jgi:cold shock CspA family protein